MVTDRHTHSQAYLLSSLLEPNTIKIEALLRPNGQTNRQTNGLKNRQKYRQTNRQTYKQTYITTTTNFGDGVK